MNKILSTLMSAGKAASKVLCFAVLFFTLASAGHLFAADALKEVKQLPIVKSLFPPEIEVIEARDLGSLYEMVVKEPRGKQIYYVTKDGAYVIAGGNVFNNDKANLTQKRREDVNRVDMSRLPLDDAVQIKRGNGAKKLIMFYDVDCPFCRRAYDWLKGQTNYTLYIFFFPLDMHPKSPDKTVQILCSKDRQAAIESAQSDKEIGSQKCEAGEKLLAKDRALGATIGVDGTPLFITDSGIRISGLQTHELESYLKQ